jgi:hypothetical protein
MHLKTLNRPSLSHPKRSARVTPRTDCAHRHIHTRNDRTTTHQGTSEMQLNHHCESKEGRSHHRSTTSASASRRFKRRWKKRRACLHLSIRQQRQVEYDTKNHCSGSYCSTALTTPFACTKRTISRLFEHKRQRHRTCMRPGVSCKSANATATYITSHSRQQRRAHQNRKHTTSA